MSGHHTIPSFMSGSKNGITKELAYKDGKYTLTFTDSNGVLSDYAFSSSDSKVSVSKSGNKLTISSANVSLPDDFDKILSVMRSRGVSVSIILQNLAQLKALFEKQWESIVGNCDEFLYLGGNEQSTHKYVSELLGKETIDTNTYGKSSGRSGNYSTNYQMSGRELMTPDEVRMLDNRYALLFVRGERPVMDFKYDILKHPNVKLTADGGQPPYAHGEPTQAVATLVFDSEIPDNAVSVMPVSTSYELLSDEDLEEIFNI